MKRIILIVLAFIPILANAQDIKMKELGAVEIWINYVAIPINGILKDGVRNILCFLKSGKEWHTAMWKKNIMD